MNEVRKSELAEAMPDLGGTIRSGKFGCNPSSLRARPVRREDDQRMEHRGRAISSATASLGMARYSGA